MDTIVDADQQVARTIAYNPGSMADFCGTPRPSYAEQRKWEQAMVAYQAAMYAVRLCCDTSQCAADCKISSLQ